MVNVGTVSITNSTIVGNENQNSNGGGIFYSGAATVRLSNVTLVDNYVYPTNSGSEIYATSASLDHSIIQGSCGGTALSGAYSLESPGNGCGLSTGSLSDLSAAALNLGGLADNGGPTQTLLPGAGSIAIGLGGPQCQPVDQRDYVRAGACDAGAVQSAASISDEIFAGEFDLP